MRSAFARSLEASTRRLRILAVFAPLALAAACADRVTSPDAETTGPGMAAQSLDPRCGLSCAADYMVATQKFTERNGALNTDLVVLTAGGDFVRRLTTDQAADYAPSLSPDHQEVAYYSERNGGGYYIVKLDGSGTRFVVSGGQGGDARREIAWSPDGRKLALSRRLSWRDELWVLNADGTGLAQLTNDDADRSSIKFSPDGSMIQFQKWHTSGGSDHLAVKIATGEIVDAPHYSTYGGSGLLMLADTSLLYVSATWMGYGDYDYELKHARRNQFNRVIAANAFRISRPSLSPDGTKVVYVADGALYTVPLDGSAAPKRIGGTAVFGSATWSNY